jgi:hypothetical protein
MTIAATWSRHGMSMTLPPSMTTMTGLPPALATASVTSLFCTPVLLFAEFGLPSSAKVVRSPLPLYSSPSS